MKSERTLFSNIFVTGCDKNTFWQLKWFIQNLRKHSDTFLEFHDFGLTPDQIVTFHEWNFPNLLYVQSGVQGRGWFNKPRTLAASYADNAICWLDTDVEVVGDIDSIFQYTSPNLMGMVPDHPWIHRRGGEWYNSGVILVSNTKPKLLTDWVRVCESKNNNLRGDQEVLYALLMQNPLNGLHLQRLPHNYNVLRLDVVDKRIPTNPIAYHWTGQKGDDIIRGLIKNEA